MTTGAGTPGMPRPMRLLAGNSNEQFASAVADELGLRLTAADVRRFSDGEVFVEVRENVRGQDVFVLQSTSPPANDHIMELLVCIDALRRASAASVTAVIPYFGYARQDRKAAPRAPISAKLVANLITTAGASRVLTIDLHANQIQGFFDIPVDNLYAAPVIAADIRERFQNDSYVLVSPDVGGVARARYLAARVDSSLAIVDKRRDRENVSEVVNIIGEVRGRVCIIVDDIVDTAGTLCNAAQALTTAGASRVACYATHGVLSGPAVERIDGSTLDMLLVTDSIAARDEVAKSPKIQTLSVVPLVAEAIRRISDHRSVSNLFD